MIDYGATRAGDWLLVGSGAGIMMAAMDVLPQFRYCVDIDSIKHPSARLNEWLAAMEFGGRRICVAGWFSITQPDALRQALDGLQCKPLVYAGDGGADLFPGYEVSETLDQFIRAVEDMEASEAGEASRRGSVPTRICGCPGGKPSS